MKEQVHNINMWLLFMRTCSYINVCGKSQLNKYAKNSLLSDGLIVETSWKFSLQCGK